MLNRIFFFFLFQNDIAIIAVSDVEKYYFNIYKAITTRMRK